MINGLLKIIAVALAYLFVYIAELSYQSIYYHAALSAAFIATSCFSILFAVKTRSNSLMVYATIYITGSILYTLMLVPSLMNGSFWFFYEAKLNYSILVTLSDSFIISLGGISVIYRFYILCRYGSDSDDIFDARVGLYKWAR